MDLSWSPATARCGGGLVYNVYRSTDPDFVPGPSQRIATCVSSTSFTDSNMASGTDTYAYVVRSEDLAGSGAGACGGIEDLNTVRRLLTPTTLVGSDFESGLNGWISLEPLPFVTLTDSMLVRVVAAEGDVHATIIEAAIDDLVIRGLDPCEPATAIFDDGFESGDTTQWSASVLK